MKSVVPEAKLTRREETHERMDCDRDLRDVRDEGEASTVRFFWLRPGGGRWRRQHTPCSPYHPNHLYYPTHPCYPVTPSETKTCTNKKKTRTRSQVCTPRPSQVGVGLAHTAKKKKKG